MNETSEPARRAQRRVGQTLGKYRVERVLGMGGMATVYLAVHRNGHRVALKVLNAELARDHDIRTRFVREGYATNSIEHPGVVRVTDDDIDEDGTPVLVMELLEGETLRSRALRCGGRLPAREVLPFAYQLLDVVAVAHAKEILHRDLKPENLFLTRDGVLKVLDFGVARMALTESGSDPTRTGHAMGTPAFMAPEQAFGKTREVDPRTDLWSVGATMFTLLSGEHVHDAENTAQLLVIAATSTARSLRSVAPEVPDAVATIVDRACAFERDDRYVDARSMQRAVADAHRTLFGEEVTAAVVVGATSRRQLESAPTLDVSPRLPPPSPLPSLLLSGLPSRVETVALATQTRGKHRRAAMVAGAALSAGVAVALAFGVRDRIGRVAPPAHTAAIATSANACTTSVACAGRLACRAGACVALESDDCTVLARAEDVKDDATVWIGAMFAKDGPMAEQFDGAIRDVELARRDFLEVASGLPSTHAGSLPRPIGVIMCNDAHDPLRAARHLADDVRVPAIVGFSRSKEVLDLAAAVFNPRHVVAFASNTASMLSEITPPPGEPRMVWRTTLSATTRASVMTALVSEVIEPELRAHVLKKGEPVRVAFLGFGNPTGMSISDAFAASLRFNGKGVADNGKDFLSLSRDDERPMADDLTRFVRELVAFGPNIVLDMATDGELVPALEGAWKGPNRPRYVSGGYGDDFWGDSVTDPTLGRRVLDVEPGLNDTANTKFDLRYDAVYDPTTSPTHSKTGGPYDAFYALAYAMVALGDAPITGSAIARSLSRIGGPGERVDVGPGGIFAATSALARGEKIDLEGTMTSLDFDPATGDPTVSFTVLCAKRLKGGGARIPSGLTWDGSTKKLVGTLRCQ